MNKSKTAAAVIGLLALPASASFGALTFNFIYDATYEGANDWPAEARTAATDAGNMLATYFSAYNATIDIEMKAPTVANMVPPDALASAQSARTGIFNSGFNNLGVVGDKIISNGANDANGADADGRITAGFTHPWSFTDSVSSAQLDFKNVLMHELTHALGFASVITEAGASEFEDGAGMNATAFTPFDQFVSSGGGTAMVDGTTYAVSSTWSTHSVGAAGTVPASPDSGLYFSGPFANAANNGEPIPLYSPEQWSDGSSGSHLDTQFYTGEPGEPGKLIMNHAVVEGLGVRALGPIEQGIMRDIGYTMIVPEPSSALLGLLGLGFLIRRKQ